MGSEESGSGASKTNPESGRIMKLFKKFKNYQECKLCHVKLNSSITKKHLEMSHASELFKFRGKYLTSVKKVVKKLRNKNGREFKLDILEKLRDCDLVTYPEAEYRLGYKCLDCHKFFMKKTAWKLHQVKRNHNSKILYCRFCPWTFHEKHQFDQHAQDYPPRQCVPMSLKKNSENDDRSHSKFWRIQRRLDQKQLNA